MARYLIRARYTPTAFKGLVSTPQDRGAAIAKLFGAAGLTATDFYYSISGGEIFFMASSNAAVDLAAIEMVVMATGTIAELQTHEVINMQEMVQAMEKAGQIAAAYVPAAKS